MIKWSEKKKGVTGLKLYAPNYYRDFACIADRCKHSCCIGWGIDIDSDTKQKYEAVTEEYGRVIRESIEDGEAPHFRLSSDERCPHLDEAGLCRIIRNVGEDYLCDICREHPRFYHDTVRGREVGLGMACEEACRLILTAKDFARFVPVAEIEVEESVAFDAVSPRDRMLLILSDTTRPYPERREAICKGWDVSEQSLTSEEVRALLDELEYLDPASRTRFSVYASTSTADLALEETLCRALAYFIFRHVSKATDEEEVRAALGFSLLCERLIASVAATEEIRTLEEMIELSRTVSEEIEYSEDNTDAIMTEFLFKIG